MDKKYSILVVDDEESILGLLKDYFRRDYTVLTAGDGLQALEVLKENEVQLVLTDQRMPKMEGMALLAQLKKEKPDVTRILMTGYTELQVAVDAINVGKIHRYLTKPLNYDELGGIIEDGLAQYEEVLKVRNMISSGKNAILDKIRAKIEKIKSIEVDKTELEKELTAAREVEERKIREMEEKINTFQIENEEKDDQIHSLEENSSQLEKTGKIKREENIQLQDLLGKRETELGTLNEEMGKIRSLAEEAEKIRAEMNEQQTKFALVNRTAVTLKSDNEQLKQNLDGALAEKGRIEKKLKQFQANWAKTVA